MVSPLDPEESSIGDIYYIIPSTKKAPKRLAYFTCEGNALIFSGFDSLDWGPWEQDIVPNLRPLSVSCASGLPILIGWADLSLGNDSFRVPLGSDPKAYKSIEQYISSVYYNALLKITPPPTHRFKPLFGALNRALRKVGLVPLPALLIWTPSRGEIQAHQAKLAKGMALPESNPKINWKLRFKKIANCAFVMPKYRQLIYWITTNTICSGKQLRHFSGRGFCPHCREVPVVANWRHMFFECPVSIEIWVIVNDLGSAHWDDYIPLDPNEIPVLLNEYHPMKLLQLSALWAFWTQWCFYFHDTEYSEADTLCWTENVIEKIKNEFKLRLYESHSAIQWMHIVADRRITSNGENSESGCPRVPEKEFLLIHSNSIRTNPENINIGEHPPEEMLLWLGNQILISQEGDVEHPKLKFNLYYWDVYTRPPDHGYPSSYQPDDWVIRPRFCVGDF